MNIRELIKEALEEHIDKSLILKESIEVSEELKYHIDNGMTLTNNVFRMYSEKYFNLVNEVRELWNEGKIDLNEEDTLMAESDLGKKVKIGKNYVYLDAPYIYETESEEDILVFFSDSQLEYLSFGSLTIGSELQSTLTTASHNLTKKLISCFSVT